MIARKDPKIKGTASMNAPGRKFRTANLSILRTAKHSDGTIERILDCVNIGLTDRQSARRRGRYSSTSSASSRMSGGVS